ncbi:MAG: hypothetical protein GXP45_05225 [bacterium]|nr:hypothetical protein [bacterium]
MFDYCPDGDFSPSYYDGQCSASNRVNEHHNTAFVCPLGASYSSELCEAYYYAYDNGITSL